jgi:hypothetical protein
MPDHPLLQSHSRTGVGNSQRSPRRLLTALPTTLLRPERETQQGGEQEQTLSRFTQREAQEIDALIKTEPSELPAPEAVPASTLSPPSPVRPEEKRVPTAETATTLPGKRPWRQRVVEIAAENVSTTALPEPGAEETQVLQEAQPGIPDRHPDAPSEISSDSRRTKRENRTQRPAERRMGSDTGEAVPEKKADAETVLSASREQPAASEPDQAAQFFALEPKPDTGIVHAEEKSGVSEKQLEQDPETTELFADEGLDRSPQAWAARLQGTQSPSPPQEARTSPSEAVGSEATARIDRLAAPALIPETSRRFLQPLLGFDLATARIHQGAVAEQATAALNAQALTSEQNIFLSAGHDKNTPEDLGLLAHELTHVVRNSVPDFIPPIALSSPASHRVQETGGMASISEETLALKVETAARHAARQAALEPPAFQAKPATFDGASAQKQFSEESEAGEAFPWNSATVSAMETATPPGEVSPWSGLPAPWEPLPTWIAPAPNAPLVEIHSASGSIAPSDLPGQEIQRAGAERHVEETAEAALPDPAPAVHAAPEPDLDRLAQQVYTRLKQRLAAERRREWR